MATQYLRYIDPTDEDRLVPLPHPAGVPYPSTGDVFTDQQREPHLSFVVTRRWFDFYWDGSVNVTLTVDLLDTSR
jgi:hypothetical protein